MNILAKIPVHHVFGDNGQKISQSIDLTRNITIEQVNLLSKYELEFSRNLYSKTWKNWIKAIDKNSPHLNENHFNTEEICLTNGKYDSPIKGGLSIIYAQFTKRARELVGEDAFTTDEDGDLCLKPTWSTASENLLHFGISYTPYNIISETERSALRKSVTEVFNLM